MAIFVTRGARLTIPAGGLTLDLDNPGPMQATIHIAYDMYPHWAEISQEHARECRRRAAVVNDLWTNGGRAEEVEAVEAEISSGMQAIVAAVTAIEGFYGTVVAVSGKPNAGKKRRARAKVVAETIKQRFRISPASFPALRTLLIDLYTLRDEAVHPTGAARLPALNNRLNTHTERRLVNFATENATASADAVLTMLVQLADLPRVEFPELESHCRYAKERLLPILSTREDEVGKRLRLRIL